MDAPPVQYVTTSDGLNIAYCESGAGRPFIFVPLPYNHIQQQWEPSHWYFPWFENLSRSFRLIQYDSRGQGMSSRGLPPDVKMEDFARDLEAVVESTGVDRFVLAGLGNALGHVAVRYAAAHPERVEALVLWCCAVTTAGWPLALFEGVAAQNWDALLQTILPRGLSREEVARNISRLKLAVDREDWVKMMHAYAPSDVAALLPGLEVPTLVLHPREFIVLPPQESMKLAAMIPGARLALIDGGSSLGDPAEGLAAICDFLAESGLPTAHRPVFGADAQALPETLTSREVEVLRFIAAGKSNREIADALVISVRTVERHIANLYTKIGARTKAQATAFALRANLI
jgi:pimeloyl-ACP methyl ester carboxylesterase/DNA-binding CsgD family transcriptional regulator